MNKTKRDVRYILEKGLEVALLSVTIYIIPDRRKHVERKWFDLVPDPSWRLGHSLKVSIVSLQKSGFIRADMMLVQHTSSARAMMNSVSAAMSFNPRRQDATSCCGARYEDSGCPRPDSKALSKECLTKDMTLKHARLLLALADLYTFRKMWSQALWHLKRWTSTNAVLPQGRWTSHKKHEDNTRRVFAPGFAYKVFSQIQL